MGQDIFDFRVSDCTQVALFAVFGLTTAGAMALVGSLPGHALTVWPALLFLALAFIFAGLIYVAVRLAAMNEDAYYDDEAPVTKILSICFVCIFGSIGGLSASYSLSKNAALMALDTVHCSYYGTCSPGTNPHRLTGVPAAIKQNRRTAAVAPSPISPRTVIRYSAPQVSSLQDFKQEPVSPPLFESQATPDALPRPMPKVRHTVAVSGDGSAAEEKLGVFRSKTAVFKGAPVLITPTSAGLARPAVEPRPDVVRVTVVQMTVPDRQTSDQPDPDTRNPGPVEIKIAGVVVPTKLDTKSIPGADPVLAAAGGAETELTSAILAKADQEPIGSNVAKEPVRTAAVANDSEPAPASDFPEIPDWPSEPAFDAEEPAPLLTASVSSAQDTAAGRATVRTAEETLTQSSTLLRETKTLLEDIDVVYDDPLLGDISLAGQKTAAIRTSKTDKQKRLKTSALPAQKVAVLQKRDPVIDPAAADRTGSINVPEQPAYAADGFVKVASQSAPVPRKKAKTAQVARRALTSTSRTKKTPRLAANDVQVQPLAEQLPRTRLTSAARSSSTTPAGPLKIVPSEPPAAGGANFLSVASSGTTAASTVIAPAPTSKPQQSFSAGTSLSSSWGYEPVCGAGGAPSKRGIGRCA